MLFLAGSVGLFLRLIFELAVIEDLADGWTGIGRDFDQIQTCLQCFFQRHVQADHAGHFAVRFYQPYF